MARTSSTSGGATTNHASSTPTDPLAAASSIRFEPSSSFVEERTNSIRDQVLLEQQQQQLVDEWQDENNIPDASDTEAAPTPRASNANANNNTQQQQSSSASWKPLAGAVVNLCSATLGAGVLSLPHACKEAGVVGAVLLLGGAALATVASIRLLVRACTYYQLYTYESLCDVLYGPRLRTACELAILVFCQGCAVAYIIAMADILQQAQLLVRGSRSWSMVVIWCGLLLPLSLQRTMAALQLSSAVGIAAIGTLVFAALIHLLDDEQEYMHHHHHHHHHNATNATIIIINEWDTEDYQISNTQTMSTIAERLGSALWRQLLVGNGSNDNTTDDDDSSSHHPVDWSALWWPQRGVLSVLTAAPIMLFAFSCQVNVPAILEELPRNLPSSSTTTTTTTSQSATTTTTTTTTTNMTPTEAFMNRVTIVAVTLCALLYASISAIALADYGTDVTPNMLQIYPMRGIMQVAAGGMVLAVTMAFPLNVFPARVTLEGVVESWLTSNDGSGGRNPDNGATSCGTRCCDKCFGCFRRRPDRMEAHATLTAALLEDQDDDLVAVGNAAATTTTTTARESSTRSTSSSSQRSTSSKAPHRRETATINDSYTAAILNELAAEEGIIADSSNNNDEEDVSNRDENIENGDAPPPTTAPLLHPNGGRPTTTTTTRTPSFPWFRHVCLTLLLAGSALGIALVAPNISIVFQIIGGTASSGLGFCVPGLLGLRLGREHQVKSFLLLYGGILMAVFTTGVTIYQIVTGAV